MIMKASENNTTGDALTRRGFVSKAAAAGAGLLILPSGVRAGAAAPSNRVNVALIGVTGRGRVFHDTLEKETNLVALCDINEGFLGEVHQRFPRAKTYVDWRKCLEQKDIDAVVICTADHTHAFITNWAMNRDLHVYCEKPMATSVEEVRLVRSRWLAKRHKLASQIGTGTAANHNRIRDLIRDGAIGDLKLAYAWTNRSIYRQGYWPDAGKPPAGLHWDLWLGPAPYHPYHPRYFSKGNYFAPGEREPVGAAGAVCLSWNCFWDFGTGQVGDMGSHDMNLLWNAVDATHPLSAVAKGDAYHPEVLPVALECRWEHPANAWRGPITVFWNQGGMMPRSPMPYIDLSKIRDGVMFKGTQGFLVGDFRSGSRVVLPYGESADLTYYRGRRKEEVTPTYGNSMLRWLEACRNPALKTTADFETGGNMIEQNLLGLVAFRAGRKISYDGATGRVADYPAANAFLKKEYRKGWTLDG
jgi:hypothetical protein